MLMFKHLYILLPLLHVFLLPISGLANFSGQAQQQNQALMGAQVRAAIHRQQREKLMRETEKQQRLQRQQVRMKICI